MLDTKKRVLNKKGALLLISLCLCLNIGLLISMPPERTVQSDNFQASQTLLPLAEHPNITAVTPNSQYFKDGDVIDLIVTCDQANYSVTANFSAIDSEFSPSEVEVTDNNDSTYLVRYALNNSNTRPDGSYQIFINVTNSTSGFSQLHNDTYLTLDNTPPNLYISTPLNGTYLLTNNITIEGYMDATTSLIKDIALNDTRFELLINRTGEAGGSFVITNSSAVSEGNITLRIDILDSVNLLNSSTTYFTLDNSPPNITLDSFTPINTQIFITIDTKGTFSPITFFEYNMSQFQQYNDPIGQLEKAIILANNPDTIPDGRHTLNITISDSVNLTNSLFIPFMLDFTAPIYDAIVRNVSKPEYYESVNISIFNPTDPLSGLSSVTLNYTTNDWNTWTEIDINSTKYGIIPAQPFNTTVQYKIYLSDHNGNTNISPIFSYVVNDTIKPTIDNIQQYPTNPTRRIPVNVSAGIVNDIGSGIAGIFLNYSINGGISWSLKNITGAGWGYIEARPFNTRVFYQILVNDTAGNYVQSDLMSYLIRFDTKRFLIILIIIGAIAGISGYSGRVIYSKVKNKSLKLNFLNEFKDITAYIELRLADLDVILSDTEIIRQNLTKLLKYEWIPISKNLKARQPYNFKLLKEFIGISHLEAAIRNYKGDFDKRVRNFNKKYAVLKESETLSPLILKFNAKIDDATQSLDQLNKKLEGKFPIIQKKKGMMLPVKFPLDEFDSQFAKVINKFREMYENLEKEFDQLLISREINKAEIRLNNFDALYEKTDEWFESAETWSRSIPIPKDRGYKYLLKLKKEQYESIKTDHQLKLEKLRAELTSSFRFAQNFIQWNYVNLSNRLQKFDSSISEDLLRLISSEETEFEKINRYIQDQFDKFTTQLVADKEKVADFAETHREFHIEEVLKDWKTLTEETVPSKLDEIKIELDDFIKPLYRIDHLIKGVTKNFYTQTIKEIERYSEVNLEDAIPDSAISPLKALFSKTVWKINRIDNEIEDWINLLPYDLKTPQLIILLRGWNETKDAVLEKLNELSKKQKIYKCEIMHEILDPLNDEIWECSNCGAIACTEHLEKWYHRKKAPECFKCGNSNTFKLKELGS